MVFFFGDRNLGVVWRFCVRFFYLEFRRVIFLKFKIFYSFDGRFRFLSFFGRFCSFFFYLRLFGENRVWLGVGSLSDYSSCFVFCGFRSFGFVVIAIFF